MHSRRHLLAGTATGAVAAIAGCLDEFGSSSDAGAADDRTGPRALSRAVGSLNEAALELDVRDDVASVDDVDFDPEPARALIEESRDHLETVAEAFDDREDDVERLRTYADALETLVDVTATVADDSLEDDVDLVTGTLGDEERPDDALAVVDDRRTALAATRDRFDDALATIRDLDADRLEAMAVVDLAEIESGAETLEGILSSLETFADGVDETLVGYDRLLEGRESLEERNYDGAESAFSDAESSFGDATDRLEGGPDADVADLRAHFEAMTCRSDHLETAANRFAGATAAARSGDPFTADEKRTAGEEAIDDARACSSTAGTD